MQRFLGADRLDPSGMPQPSIRRRLAPKQAPKKAPKLTPKRT
jgi:hypothetical protein